MLVNLLEISKEGSLYRVQDSDWLPQPDIDVVAVKNAEIFLKESVDSGVKLTGNLSARIAASCGRCGQPAEYDIDEDFTYLLSLQEEQIDSGEKECSAEECDTLYLDEPVVDCSMVLQEQLMLSVQQRVLCRDDCQGICPTCGGLIGTGECRCEEDYSDSPFAVLKTLKNK